MSINRCTYTTVDPITGDPLGCEIQEHTDDVEHQLRSLRVEPPVELGTLKPGTLFRVANLTPGTELFGVVLSAGQQPQLLGVPLVSFVALADGNVSTLPADRLVFEGFYF